MENENRIRGQKEAVQKDDNIDIAAKKVARTLAECKATYADVKLIFERAKGYLIVDAADGID